MLLVGLCWTRPMDLAGQIPTAVRADSARADTAGFFDKALDLFEFPINRAGLRKNPAAYPAKLVVAPIVSYAPETNWGLGVGAKLLFKVPGAGKETRTSNMPLTALYTLNNQLLLGSGYTLFFNREQYLLKGNLLFSKFPQLFYGVGNNTPEKNEELFAYNSFLLEPLLLRRVVGKLFVGGGIRYNNVWNLDLKEGGLLAELQPAGYRGSRSAGLEWAVTYDSRDNVLNATRGMLTEFTHGRYGHWLGGTHRFQLTKLDVRQYIKPFARRPDVLAFQLYGYFSTGQVPLIELAALGGPELMRGYYDGRYLDRNLVAGQVEYRRPLTGRLGVVVFAGAGQVAPKPTGLRLDRFKPSFGAGIRFKIVKEENLNVRFDYGVGRGTSNYYFNIAEAF